jgi:hypothetical protein
MFLRLKATRIIGHHFLEVVNNNIPYDYLLKSKLNIKKYLLSKLRIKYKAIWHQELFRDNSGQGYGNKLRTYRLFKNTFNFEHYISCAQS